MDSYSDKIKRIASILKKYGVTTENHSDYQCVSILVHNINKMDTVDFITFYYTSKDRILEAIR